MSSIHWISNIVSYSCGCFALRAFAAACTHRYLDQRRLFDALHEDAEQLLAISCCATDSQGRRLVLGTAEKGRWTLKLRHLFAGQEEQVGTLHLAATASCTLKGSSMLHVHSLLHVYGTVHAVLACLTCFVAGCHRP